MTRLTEDQQERIRPFVTSLTSDVYALINLPPQVAGAVISRFSRTNKGARELLATEFIHDLPPIAPQAVCKCPSFCECHKGEQERATAFYDRVLGAYGDDSIAELGGLHIIVENCSLLAAKALEESRYISAIEQSTRYVALEKTDKGYPYYNPVFYLESMLPESYAAMGDKLFGAYHAVKERATEWLNETLVRPERVSDSVWNRSVTAKALDIARGLLPLATLCNVGIYANARTYEDLIYDLVATNKNELYTLANQIYAVCDSVMPAMVRRVNTDKGDWAISRRQMINQDRTRTSRMIRASRNGDLTINNGPCIDLVYQTPDAARRVAESIYFAFDCESHGQSFPLVDHDVYRVLQEAIGPRNSRYDKAPKEFELVAFEFEIVSSIGTWRDLQRHRVTTQIRQPFTARHGYMVPQEVVDMGMEDTWRDAAGNAGTFVRFLELHDKAYVQEYAPYMLPLCYQTRYRMYADAKEWYHICELRSQPQGHAEYRMIAMQIAEILQEEEPLLFDRMTFIGGEPQSGLERLQAEQRSESKGM